MTIGTETIVCGLSDMAHCAPSNIKGLGRATPCDIGGEVMGRYWPKSKGQDVAFGGNPKPSGRDPSAPGLDLGRGPSAGGGGGENRGARYTISTSSRAIPIFLFFQDRRVG